LAIGSNGIDLILEVRRPDETPLRCSATSGSNLDDSTLALRPFALDAEPTIPEIKREVIRLVLNRRLQNSYSELDGLGGDYSLRNRTFAVWISLRHEHMFAHSLSPNKAQR
jgi:hypothetical protein